MTSSRPALSSIRNGIAQTRPVLYVKVGTSIGFCFAAHITTVCPAMLASARPESTAWTASALVP